MFAYFITVRKIKTKQILIAANIGFDVDYEILIYLLKQLFPTKRLAINFITV